MTDPSADIAFFCLAKHVVLGALAHGCSWRKSDLVSELDLRKHLEQFLLSATFTKPDSTGISVRYV